MILLPAIDLYEKKVVRLTRGDYAQMTVYHDNPVAQATLFQEAGAQWLHTVDLEGAKDGSTPNYSVIEAILQGDKPEGGDRRRHPQPGHHPEVPGRWSGAGDSGHQGGDRPRLPGGEFK